MRHPVRANLRVRRGADHGGDDLAAVAGAGSAELLHHGRRSDHLGRFEDDLAQTVTPSALLGRVSAITIASYGARPIGAALGGLVGGLAGAEASLILAAIGFALQVATIVLSPLPGLARPPKTVNGVAARG